MTMKNDETATHCFDNLQTGLLEGSAHFQGETKLKVMTITVPDRPPAYDAARVRTLRMGLGFSQSYFSLLLNVSPKTLQSWEQGARTPSQASARLLQLIEYPHLLDSLRAKQTSQREAAD